jgi:hypothetical protein
MSSSKWALSFFLLSTELNLVYSDIYMHNPRGSNDRNCERNVNRNNGNRLFDSQNNAKGGYACPRAVGAETVQNEDGEAKTGQYTQDKKMYFYEGSYLPIEWTNQHGCGRNSKANCEIVLQYMCEDTADPQVDNFWPYTDTKNCGDSGAGKNCGTQAFRSNTYIAAPRDGIPTSDADAATDTIPDTEDAAIPDNAADRRYGMHESYGFYDLCQHTSRNRGLYTADQRVRRNDQRGTRQNPNGNRRGLECPEERDYYPWWHPSPWIDIAVLTNDAGNKSCTTPMDDDCNARCKYYLENSFNTNYKGYCDILHNSAQAVTLKTDNTMWNQRKWYNNEEECTANGFTWYEVSLKDVINVSYPICERTGFSRVNQLGNAADRTVSSYPDELGAPDGLNANRFMWTIPKIPAITTTDTYFDGIDDAGMVDAYKSCVVRIRYNLSTSDFPAWPADAMETTHPWRNEMVTAANNSASGDFSNTPLTQDPYIYIGTGDEDLDDDTSTRNGAGDEKFVSLAVNTNQYARTFQDRSYKFRIAKRPTEHAPAVDATDTPRILAVSEDTKVFNVNVRGKRGNIVQTYPAVEYDFVPNSLSLSPGDVVHFQWTGSDYNPRRGCNDAEGGPPDPNNYVSSSNDNSRADRSNLIFVNTMAENAPMDYITYTAYTDDDNAVDPMKGQYSAKVANMKEQLYNNTPCTVTGADCFDQVMRLAYLNQQSDGGSLALRRGAACLTQEELDDISNEQERQNHPLNCAKMNAKPYPYFDAGVMKVNVPGKFSFFSSRNNNFSNRDQTGIICVKGMKDDGTMENCAMDTSTGVLQDTNQALASNMQTRVTKKDAATAACIDSANSASKGTANDQGATSCITSSTGTSSDTLSSESFTTEQAANDAMGDGDKKSCDEIAWFFSSKGSVVSYLGLAVGLAFVGFFAAWASLYCYNRIKAQREAQKETKFEGSKEWKKTLDDRQVI